MILGSFITIAAVFNFVEDYCTNNSKKNKDVNSDTNIEESNETSFNVLHGDEQSVVFDNRELKVNIPIESSSLASNSHTASNSDNELDLDDDQSETAALLAPG